MRALQIIGLLILIPVCGIGQNDPADTLKIRMTGEGHVCIYISQKYMEGNSPGDISRISIYRSVGTPYDWVELGKVTPASSKEEFLKMTDENMLENIKIARGFQNQDDAWKFVKKNQGLDQYGLLILNYHFLEAIGAVYIDRNTKNLKRDIRIFYKIKYKNEGSKDSAVGNLIMGMPPDIDKPMVANVEEGDSTIMITWKNPNRASNEAFFAIVFKNDSNSMEFRAEKVIAASRNEQENAIIYSYLDKEVQPGRQYAYFIIPITLTQYPGMSSDTIVAISKDLRNLPVSVGLTARDSAGGIFLSWSGLKDYTFIRGVIIEKSSGSKEDYYPIDTIPENSLSYFDKNIDRQMVCYYRLLFLVYGNRVLDPNAYAWAEHSDRVNFVAPPVMIKAVNKGKEIQVDWHASKSKDVQGYILYRSDNISGSWISLTGFTKDTTFLDTTIVDTRREYKYKVEAMKTSQSSSGFSDYVSGKVDNLVIPFQPANLSAKGSEEGIVLAWTDMSFADPYITGYKVYRKATSVKPEITNYEKGAVPLKVLGYEPVYNSIIRETYCLDKSAKPGMDYTYAVTSVDVFGKESDINSIEVMIPEVKVTGPDIYLTVIKSGVVVSWNPSHQEDVTGYAIYRKNPKIEYAYCIGRVNKETSEYVDKTIGEGALYTYWVCTLTGQGESEPGASRSIKF